MIARWNVHFEYHRGYRPRFSIRRAPKHGDRGIDGGEPGTLIRCEMCGDGFLHMPDRLPPILTPSEQ